VQVIGDDGIHGDRVAVQPTEAAADGTGVERASQRADSDDNRRVLAELKRRAGVAATNTRVILWTTLPPADRPAAGPVTMTAGPTLAGDRGQQPGRGELCDNPAGDVALGRDLSTTDRSEILRSF
jgi:hypothetical protein